MIRKLLLAVVILEIPLQLDNNIGFDPSEAVYGALSGYNVSLTTLSLLLLYVMWIPRLIRNSALPDSIPLRFSWPLVGYLFFVTISVLLAQDPRLASYGWVMIIQAFLLFFYLANTLDDENEVFYVVCLLLVGMAMQSVMMIATRFVTQTDIEFGPFSFYIDDSALRVGGSLGSPTAAASYFELLLPIGLAVLLCRLADWRQWLALLAVGLGSVALLLTASRASWFVMAVAGFLFFVLAARRQLFSPRFALTVGISLVLVGLTFGPFVMERLLGDDDGSAKSRVPLMMIAAQMINDYPLFGVGLNNFTYVAQDYAGQAGFRGEWFFTVHNKFLLVWSEVGTMGLFCFVSFLFSMLWTGWSVWMSKSASLAPLGLGIALGIACQMAHMMVDMFNSRVVVQMLWLCMGLLVAIAHLARAPSSSKLMDSLPNSAGLKAYPAWGHDF